jgi:hypothetical protein
MTTLDELKSRIDSLEGRVSELERALNQNARTELLSSSKKKPAAREFLMTRSVKSEPQKVLALGYFLEHIEGVESFNIKDIERVFRAAKEKPPKNINDAVNKSIARGHLMEAAEKKDSIKAWCITSTGEHYIENDLNRNEG